MMKTFTVKYEAGAVNRTATVVGKDVYDAMRRGGLCDNPQVFMWHRVVTWSEVA